MKDLFANPYNHKENEREIYKKWEESGFFNPDNLPKRHKIPYTIIMPPLNANGRLHAGHGLDMSLKDIAIRFERMRGKKALFLPGADHGGFETQMVFEKKMQKEGKSRGDITSQELYSAILDFTLENKSVMESDLRDLGISCDWSRNKFTLDEDVIESVQKTFIKMYKEGLIYRGDRVINWNSKFQTSLSDIETNHIERKDPFYYFKYGPFTIGTVRPETKFGDKYVVMHPDDKRYKKYKHREKIEVEWINGPIQATIIKDTLVDMDFGTGVMTITPWHSAVDFEIATRHNLEKEQIIDFYGKLLPIAQEFEGIKISQVREKIIEKMKKKGLLVSVDENYTHSITVCERTKFPIEPQIKSQWFVKMRVFADSVIEAVDKKKEITILPDHQKKILLHWMRNTLDWNISRQIIWGIRIPAWFKNGEVKASLTCPGSGWKQDEDTFDTWFSSGQWPLLALSYPDSKDFKTFYPTDFMEAGKDLVFKWIPRMILFGLYLTKEVPFKNVYFHGMVNDEKNKKMSKSKGNVISPIDIAQEYGTDALRMGLIIGNAPGNSIPLQYNKVKGYKHFANKVWNITRFVLNNINITDLNQEKNLLKKHQDMLTAFNKVIEEITEDLERFRFDIAADKIYHYIWHTFADVILEDAKKVLNGDKEDEKESYRSLLYILLSRSLKVLHPFMPFVTEKIWSLLPPGREKSTELLMVETWPKNY